MDKIFIILLLKLFGYKLLPSFKTNFDFSKIAQEFFYKMRKPHSQMIFNDNDIYMNINFDNQRSYNANFIGISLNKYFW